MSSQVITSSAGDRGSVAAAAHSRDFCQGGNRVTYFCYVQSLNCSVPHMEPLDAEDIRDAHRLAEQLLKQHSNSFAAHLFEGPTHIASVYGPLPHPDRAAIL